MATKFNLSDPADLGTIKVGRLAALFAIIILAIRENKIRNILVFACSFHIPKSLLETEVDKMMKFVDQNYK